VCSQDAAISKDPGNELGSGRREEETLGERLHVKDLIGARK